MKFSKNVARGLAVSAMVVGLVALPTLPASAQLVTQVCASPGTGYVYGISTTSVGRTTEDGVCGTVYVRVYYAHPGGATWTLYTSNATQVSQYYPNISNVQHKATYKTAFYSNPYLP